MAAVPIYVWNGTAWQETGPVIPASPIKYQASAPSSPSTGDIWVDSDGDVTTGSQQFQRFRFVASGGETSISGVDANGATLAYTAGTEIVALNGSTLVRGQDYTATNGTSITGLSPALVAGDVVEVFSFMAFNVANTYTQSQVDGLLNDYMGTRLLIPASVSSGGTISSTGTVTFSGVSSISLNGIFTSTYDNYIINFKATASSATTALNMKLRKSGVDLSSGYDRNGTITYNNSATITSLNVNNSTAWGFPDINSSFPTYTYFTFTLFSPYLTAPKQGGLFGNGVNGTNQIAGFTANFSQGDATAHDGFTLATGSGTFGGTIRVYGYKN